MTLTMMDTARSVRPALALSKLHSFRFLLVAADSRRPSTSGRIWPHLLVLRIQPSRIRSLPNWPRQLRGRATASHPLSMSALCGAWRTR